MLNVHVHAGVHVQYAHVHVSSVFLDNTAVRLKVYSSFLRSRQDEFSSLGYVKRLDGTYVHRHHNNYCTGYCNNVTICTCAMDKMILSVSACLLPSFSLLPYV